MKLYGIRGQALWFAFGTWAGAVLAALLEIILRKEIRVGSYFNNVSSILTELAISVFMVCLLTIPYTVWLWARTYRKGQRAQLHWLIPLILGIIFLPLLCGMIPLLIVLAGQGQGTIIGTMIGSCILGFPVVFAEMCFRVACRRRSRKNPDM
jgi:hypothetical protein